MDQHSADCCKCHKQAAPAQQSLSDMDFDRGIWNADYMAAIRSSGPISIKSNSEQGPLLRTIYNEADRVRNFIKNGKCMDRDNCDYTALHYAARNGNYEICKILVNDGKADVNAITKGGVTPLHRAAMMGHLDIVKFLINSKANVMLQDEDGQTALHRAAVRGHLEVIKYLINIQPELKNVKDNKDKIPYECLSENANDDFKILLKP